MMFLLYNLTVINDQHPEIVEFPDLQTAIQFIQQISADAAPDDEPLVHGVDFRLEPI